MALPVTVSLALPSDITIGPGNAAVRLHLSNTRALALLAGGRIGELGEAVVEGRVHLEGRMRDVMAAMIALLPSTLIDGRLGWWGQRLLQARSRWLHSLRRDAEQIQFHYDVSDDFYALWQDPRRVYSCAYYRDDHLDLAQAQEAKLELICRKLDLRPGQRFLDVGAGWGGLLLWAAEHHGVDATGITLSRNQHAHVQRLIEQKGLGGRVRMQLLDYRELPQHQPYDRIASVGMFEHVGRANLPTYFDKLRALLRPGGLLLNHGITAGGLGDFIDKYIFPGGELVHASLVQRELAASGLETLDVENLRPHYARTLWAWSDALEAQLEEAARILNASAGPERGGKILRAYRLYLAGCAVAFEHGWVSLHQMLAARPDGDITAKPLRGAQCDYPFRREHFYRDRVIQGNGSGQLP